MWVGLKRILRSYLCLCLPSSRLLGPSAAADILQLSSSLPLQSRGRARLLVGNEDVHIIARSDDELLDDFFHEQSSTGGQAGRTLTHCPPVHAALWGRFTRPTLSLVLDVEILSLENKSRTRRNLCGKWCPKGLVYASSPSQILDLHFFELLVILFLSGLSRHSVQYPHCLNPMD